MEIGNNEISQKIRSAIKAKLMELGSYVDDELPDYIMVMIANKKDQDQMTDDLSLFLGNNTVTFTSWLHSVMVKLSKPTAELKPKKAKERVTKSKKVKEKKTVSPSQTQAKESVGQTQPVKSDHAMTASSTDNVAPPAAPKRQMAAVKTTKPDPSQDVISLKPEDDFLEEELAQDAIASEMTQKQSAVVSPLHADVKEKSSHEEKAKITRRKSDDKKSATYIPSHPSVSITVSPTKSPISRKRKAPGSVIGQILNVEEEEDSDEPVSFGKKVASTVLPQRRPSLPVAKQANTSLLKKAVSAAQASTSHVLTARIKQQTPNMAPRRFKIVRKVQPSPPKRNLLLKAIQEAKESISHARQSQGVGVQRSIQVDMPVSGLVSRSSIMELSERDYDAQEFMTVSTDSTAQQVEEYYADDEGQDETESPDSRHICMSADTSPPQVMYTIDDEVTDHRVMEPVYKPTPLTTEVMQSETLQRPVSPKFIVTLEGAIQSTAKTKQRQSARVAPRLSITRTIDNSMMYADFVELQQQQKQHEQKQQLEDELARQRQEQLTMYEQEIVLQQRKQQMLQQQQQAMEESRSSEDRVMFVTRKANMDQVEEMQICEEEFQEEEDPRPSKKEGSAAERCMFWPACKNGSNCKYIHPTTPCRTFPNCKFGDKCLFIHPNCKYDSRCSRSNCPFTHATRKQGHQALVSPPAVIVAPPPVHVPPKVSKVCKFHPNCKNARCPFLHAKVCLFGRGCTRTGCPFTHPQVATGASLKWSKQTHISDRPFTAKDISS